MSPGLGNNVIDSEKDDKMDDKNDNVAPNDNFPRAKPNEMPLLFNFDPTFDGIESKNEDDEV